MKQFDGKYSSVEKALRVLQVFQEPRPFWGVRELSAHLNFSPATVLRILQTLKNYGFVDQDPNTRLYRLGTIYYCFLHALQSTHPISRTALPYLQQLTERTHETAHLNTIDGVERLCIENVESLQPLKAAMPIGSRSPLYAGASSKCLLAFSTSDFIDSFLNGATLRPIAENTITDPKTLRKELHLIQRQGFAVSLGERNPGLGSLSAPILNHQGVLLAAISLAMPEIRFQDRRHRNFCLDELLATAGSLGKAMGFESG
ncbi:MAG: IclR family transcriptional regulator [Desulfobacterales bacterium]|nr:IclR family transcriptional regulator [Desulfobacterales bacterium]